MTLTLTPVATWAGEPVPTNTCPMRPVPVCMIGDVIAEPPPITIPRPVFRVDPGAPSSTSLAMLARDLHAMIEAGEMRRLPGVSVSRLRRLAMHMDEIAGVVRALEPVPTRRVRWWRVFG